MNTVSGIDKPSIEWEVPNTGREVYRVIITGSTSAIDAKTEAEYIAVHGGPSNGCSYFSISNTLAGVSPEPDCSLKDGLKVVWKEDFGVIDSTLTRTFDGASTLTYYTTTSTGGMENAAPAYSVTCAPDSALPRANQWSSFRLRQKLCSIHLDLLHRNIYTPSIPPLMKVILQKQELLLFVRILFTR